MRKILAVLLILVTFLNLLSSCTSVYVAPPEVTTEPLIEVDRSQEYFTTGYLYAKPLNQSGFMYGDYWVYVESCPYEYAYKNGNETYTGDEIFRIVKMNAKTGVISSACLDPVCNHSPGSNCLMLLPFDKTLLSLGKLVGDWLVFSYYGIVDGKGETENYIYNLKTGEAVKAFEIIKDEMSITKWNSLFDYENKLYNVKCYLDYSNTGYDPKGNKKMSAYTPETTSWLCVYDFDTKKSKELFVIPADYQLCAMSNLRYFFKSPEEEIYSCDLKGENFKKEEVLYSSPIYLCGPYAYIFAEDGLDVYDVTTDTMSTIAIEDASYAVYVTDIGPLVCTFTTCEEWMALDRATFQEMHPEIPIKDFTQAWSDELNRIMYSGNAQIWKLDDTGENRELIFEKEHAYIRIFYATGDYAFAVVSYGDPDNDYAMLPQENSGRSVINLKTGEIIPIPYLEVFVNE